MDRTTIALQGTLAGFLAEMAKAQASGDTAASPAIARPASLLGRLSPLPYGWDMLDDFSIDTFAKQIVGPVLTHAQAHDRKGRPLGDGINFASQDYLSLACHPQIQTAAVEAIARYGVHSAGSPALMGNTTLSVALEQRLASFLGMRSCALFPTGWGAGYGAIRTLVRPGDHVVIDHLSHASLWEGARGATKHVHSFAHLSVTELEAHLVRIRQEDASAGILVVTESLFSMDADSPDLQAHQELAHRHQATLMVDVAHDLGSMGPHGLGALETQGMLGKVDVVMGSFSKTFAANGGFVACNEPGLKLAIRFGCGPHTFTNAMSPVQAAVVLKALDIVQSPEGQVRRQNLLNNALHLRQLLQGTGHTVLGLPSAVVPLVVGGIGRSRLLTRFMLAGGMLVNLVEHPAVPRDASRLRLQIMADHTFEQIDQLAAVLAEASRLASEELARINLTRPETEQLR